MCTLLSAGWGVEPIKLSEREDLTGPLFLEGEEVAGKEGVTFFRGDCNFYIKNKLKSELFNNEKVYRQKYFSLL